MRETPQAAHAFMLYRDMGPERSLERLHQAYPDTTPSVRWLKVWSSAHHWVDRAHAHDAAISAAAAEADKKRRLKDMAQKSEDRLKVAAASRGKGVGGLQTLAPESISDVVRLFEYADKTERLEYGQVTERYDVRTLTTAELVAELALLEAADTGDPGGDSAAHGSGPLPLPPADRPTD